MKCKECGGPLGSSFSAGVTKTCPKCAGVQDAFEWHPKVILPYHDNIPDFTTTHDYTGTWWVHTSELSFVPKHIFAQDPVFFGNPSADPCPATTPADPTLEAIGRAFDDALDLAYLG